MFIPETDPPAALGTVTSTTLLEGLMNPANATIWRQWIDRYRPVVVRFAQRAGVGEDAEDVAQAALIEFARAYREGRYERKRGRLRSWLFGIARHHVLRWRRKRDGEAELVPLPPDRAAPDPLETVWDEEWRVAVVQQCLVAVRGEFSPSTLDAFERFVLGDRAAAEVAAELGLSENAVFGAKRRVLRRLRELEPLMTDVF